MKFELITENGRLWDVRYDECLDNDIADKDSFVDYLNELK